MRYGILFLLAGSLLNAQTSVLSYTPPGCASADAEVCRREAIADFLIFLSSRTPQMAEFNADTALLDGSATTPQMAAFDADMIQFVQQLNFLIQTDKTWQAYCTERRRFRREPWHREFWRRF